MGMGKGFINPIFIPHSMSAPWPGPSDSWSRLWRVLSGW